MQESQRSKQPEFINIDSDDDDTGDDEEAQYQADLRRALEASKAPTQQVSPPAHDPKTEQSKPGPSSFLAERAKLERDRLERQKRLRGEAGLGDPRTDQHEAESDTDSDISMNERPTKKQHLSSPPTPLVSAGASSVSGTEIFWDGELRQTATRFAEPRADGQRTFRLTQVLGNVSPRRVPGPER